MFLVLSFRGCSYFPTPAVAHKADLESCLVCRPSAIGLPRKKGEKDGLLISRALLFYSLH